MSEQPAKRQSLFGRMRSWSLKTWAIILVAESAVFVILIALLVWIVFRK